MEISKRRIIRDRKSTVKPLISLPDEIIEQILSRLPTKYFLRCSSVCKHWLSLTSDPIIIQSQLKHVLSHQNHNRQKLMFLSSDSSRLCSVDYESPNCKVQQYDLPFSAPYGACFFGSCNGLLCIGIRCSTILDGDYRPIIWNPLLKKYRSISGIDIPFHYSYRSWIGFGYDSHTEDYKFIYADPMYSGDLQVYSLKTNSHRSSELKSYINHESLGWSRDVGILLNGYIYWIVKKFDAPDHHVLIRFDLKYKTLGQLKLLPVLVNEYMPLTRTKLIDFRGCLGIFTHNCSPPSITLLRMNEDCGNVVTWKKVTKIRYPYETVANPICLMTSGEVLMKLEVEDISLPSLKRKMMMNRTSCPEIN